MTAKPGKTGSLIPVILLCFLFLYPVKIFSQGNGEIDSLLLQLDRADTDSLKVNALCRIFITWSKYDYKKAVSYVDTALLVARNAHNEKLTAMVLNNGGDVYMRAGLLDVAARHYTEYLELVNKSGSNSDKAVATINIAAIRLLLNEFDESKALLSSALSLLQEEKARNNDTVLKPLALNIYNNLGIIYREKGLYDSSLLFLNKGLRLANVYPQYYRSISQIHSTRAQVLMLQKKYDDAIRSFGKTLDIRQRNGMKSTTANIYYNLGKIYSELGNPQLALSNYSTSFRIASEVNDLLTFCNVSQSLSEYYKNNGSPDSALKYLNLSVESEKKAKKKASS